MPHSYTIRLANILETSNKRRSPIKVLCPLCPYPRSFSLWVGSDVDDGGLWWHWYADHRMVDVEHALWKDKANRYAHFDCVVCGLKMREFFMDAAACIAGLDMFNKRPTYLLMLHMLLMDRKAQQDHMTALLLMGADILECSECHIPTT